MKNVPIALSGISLVAVAILYFLHFSSGGSKAQIKDVVPSNLTVAYINSDSVLKYYDYYKEVKSRFEAKGKKLDQDLQNRAQALQNEIGAYQRNVSTMTIGQAKAVEEDLGKKQQNFRQYQQSIEQDLVNDQSKVNAELYGNITKKESAIPGIPSKMGSFLKKMILSNNLSLVCLSEITALSNHRLMSSENLLELISYSAGSI